MRSAVTTCSPRPSMYATRRASHSRMPSSSISCFRYVCIAALSPSLVALPVNDFGSEDQKQRILPTYTDSRFVPGSLALVEPEDAPVVLFGHCFASNRHFWDAQLPALTQETR